MIKHIISFLLFALSIFLISDFFSGISVSDIKVAFFVAIVLGIINVVLRPILIFFTIPINIMSLGLFTFVINAFLIMLASWIINGFNVDGFFPALIFSLALSIVHFILNRIFKK